MKPWLHSALWSLRSSQKRTCWHLLTPRNSKAYHSIQPSSLCLFLLRMEPVSSSGGLASATFQGLLVFSQRCLVPVWLSKVTDLSMSKTHTWPQGIATTKEHDMSSISRAAHWKLKGADLFWEFFLFFFGIFFLVGGGFGAVQAPFWENPGVKCRFRAVFQDIWGGFRAENCRKKQIFPFISVFCVCVCACACVFLCMRLYTSQVV